MQIVHINGAPRPPEMGITFDPNRLRSQPRCLQLVQTDKRPSSIHVSLFSEDRHARMVTIDIAPYGNVDGEIWRRYVIFEKKDGTLLVHPYWDYRADATSDFNYKFDPPRAAVEIFARHRDEAIRMATASAS